MCSKSFAELLNLAENGSLDGDDLTVLQQHVDGCPRGRYTVSIVRERCVRLAAPAELRVRILQAFRHRQV